MNSEKLIECVRKKTNSVSVDEKNV